jgi:hypothetical protein
MKRLRVFRLVWIVAAMAGADAAHAQVFECIDAKGAKAYGQFCPPGTVRQRQVFKGAESGADTGTAPAGTPRAAPKSVAEQEAEFRKRTNERQEAETKTAQEKAQAEEAERICMTSRAQLKALEEGVRYSRFDPATGERVQFGDEERAAETALARKAVEQWCSK